jgi:hypothetical protein
MGVCAVAPDLTKATLLALRQDGAKKDSTVKVTIDETAPCLLEHGARSLYAVFALPESKSEYVIGIESMMLESGVFAPRLALLGPDGALLREIPQDAFLFHGSVLSVQVRHHPNERFLLLASQPEKAGQIFRQAHANVTANYGGYGITYYTGEDVTRQYFYSHSGIVTVSIGPVPDPSPR